MAFLTTQRCSGCGETKEVCVSANRSGPVMCGECEKKAEEKRIQDYADSLTNRMVSQFDKNRNGLVACVARVMAEELMKIREGMSHHADVRIG